MIDLHSHILPGIDDGSKSSEMSRQMLAALRRQGVEMVVATPHFYAQQRTPKRFLQRRDEAFQRLEDREGVILGAEVAYIDGMSRWEELPQLQLGNSGLLLVEMPFESWTHRAVEEVCSLPAQTGLTPVLAHVERYRRKDQLPRFMDDLLAQGVLFQCNAEAFLRLSGRRWALEQLKKGNIHFLGSDTHDTTVRPPRMAEAAAVIDGKLGSGTVDRITAFTKQMLKV